MPRTPEVCLTVCPQLSAPKSAGTILRFQSLHGYMMAAAGVFRLITFGACLLLLSSSLLVVNAQSATATLSGTVTDQAGAVIPGVHIAVISIAQGFQRTTTTNDEGGFLVPLLPPGNYTVKAEHEGFTPAEVRNVILNVNDQRAIKVYLKVGSISQTVEIVDGSSLIDESPVVSTVIDRQFVANLPLNGRSFQQLITLTPGTVLAPTSGTEFGQFSVNGQRADANYAMVDGVSANVSPTYATGTAFSQNNSGSVIGFSALGTTSNLVSVDALQEFKVLTSSFAPESGRTPGAQVSIVTRSGENNLHWSLFEYFRNDVLDSNDWFANSSGQKRAALRQNIFGGTFSGPVLLPRFGEGGKQPWYDGHQRTFFFFSYEGHRLRLPTFATSDVPSLEARAAATQPAIKQLLEAFPKPTGAARPNRFAEFAAAYSNPSSLDATSIRLDHVVSPKLLLFGRYNYSPSDSVSRGNPNSLNVVTTTGNKTQTLTFGITSPLTAMVNNEFRANWSRVRGSQTFTMDEFGGAVPPPMSFFVLPQFATPRSGGFISLSGGSRATLRVGTLADNLLRQLNFTENLSIARDSHQLKFGIDYRRLTPLIGASDYTAQTSFAGVNGALTGRSLSASVILVTSGLEPVYTNFSAYGQDTWKVNGRFTLTYGLRWDVNPPPHEKNGNDPAVVTGLENLATATLAPFGTPLYQTTYNNFAPRVGVAYQLMQRPGREAVLRAGFGVFYDLGNQTTGGAFGNGFPFTAQTRVLGALFPLPAAQLAPPVPSRALPATTLVSAYDPELKLPLTYQWNIALEQSLGPQQTISATYVGAAGRRLLRQQTTGGTALKNPNFPALTITRNTATSDYHALQIQFQRRLSRGLQLLAFHSWSHSIDIASRDSATIESLPIAGIPPEIDRGSSEFDLRHVFRMAATYELPLPSRGRVGRALLRRWSIDAIYNAQSAPAVDVNYLISPIFETISIFARPDLIAGVPLYLNDASVAGGRRINPAAFSMPTTIRQGTLGRNSLRGFPVSQLDFVVRRQFNLSERLRLQFRSEFFNIFNHPNFAKPQQNLGTLSFGQFFPNANFGRSINMLGRGLTSSTTSGLNPLYQMGAPRSLQFSLRLEY